MRTSLRVFLAAMSAVLLGALVGVVPFASQAGAVNGVTTISVESKSVAEGNSGNGDVTVNVSLSSPAIPGDPNISADIKPAEGSARAGQDYNANVSCHMTWSAGQQTKPCLLAGLIKGDTFVEPNEQLTLNVVNPTSASAGTPGTLTITNDDAGGAPQFKIQSPAAAPEGSGDRHVVVTLQNPQAQAATIDYATSDGTATSDSSKGAVDYTPIPAHTLHFPANATSPTEGDVVIQIHNDAFPEPDESFNVNFSNPNNGTINPNENPAVVTLQNDDGQASDVPKLTLQNIDDKLEGDVGTSTQTVTVSISPAPPQVVSVDYTTVDGAGAGGAVASAGQTKGDYETAHGTLTFPAGSTTSQTFQVTINGDAVDERDEIYHVTLSNPHSATLADPATKDAKILNDDYSQITTGAGKDGGPHVRLFGRSGADEGGWLTFSTAQGQPPYSAGIHVGRGDFFKADGSIGSDGVDEVIIGPGKTFGPKLLIYSIAGKLLATVTAYDSNFFGGVFVAGGNLDGNPANGDELVVGPGEGMGPNVRVFRVNTGNNGDGTTTAVLLNSFWAYDQGFGGGVRVAVGDVQGDGKEEIVTAPGRTGGPNVRVFAGNANGTPTPLANFFAYPAANTGGLSVAAAAGSTPGTGKIVTGTGPGSGPHVKVFDGAGNPQGGGFFAYDGAFTGGVWVGAGNFDSDSAPEIVTGAGYGGGPHVKVFNLAGQQVFGPGFFAYDPNFHGGVEVAVSVGTAP